MSSGISLMLSMRDCRCSLILSSGVLALNLRLRVMNGFMRSLGVVLGILRSANKSLLIVVCA